MTCVVLPENVHFVRERSEKAPLCTKLGINVFVDDHLSVLACFDPRTTLRIYFKDKAKLEASNVLLYHKDLLTVHNFEMLGKWLLGK